VTSDGRPDDEAKSVRGRWSAHVPALVLVIGSISLAARFYEYRTNVGPGAYGLGVLALAAAVLIKPSWVALASDLWDLAVAGVAVAAIVLSGPDPNPVWFLAAPALVLAIMRPAARRNQARLVTQALLIIAALVAIAFLIFAAILSSVDWSGAVLR
jgi:hypothetical protein